MLTVSQRRFFVVAYSVLGAVFVVALMGVMLKGAPIDHVQPPGDTPETDPDRTGKSAILLKTEPADVVAAVMVDGRHQGQTPPGGHALTLSGLAPGRYVLKLQAEGYDDWLKEVQLDDKPLELTARMTPQTPAALTVTSIPAHAEVFVDGVPRGRTPLELSDLRPGSATVRLELEGYHNVKEGVQLVAGQTRSLAVTLKSKTAEHYLAEIREHPRSLSAHVDLCHHYLVTKDFEAFEVWLPKTLTLARNNPDDPEYQRRLNRFIQKIKNSKATYENLTDEERRRIVEIYNQAKTSTNFELRRKRRR